MLVRRNLASQMLWMFAIAVALPLALPRASSAVDPEFNKAGNILISDQFNNRVIEINPAGRIVWQYGIGPSDMTATSVLGVNDAERVYNLTLISATGIPAGIDPLFPEGVPDNRVMFVNPKGVIVWQYGQFGVTGSGPNELNTPVQATWLRQRLVMITDQGNQRVIMVDLDGRIIWQYGTTGVSGNDPDELNDPNSAEMLPNGDILIADEGNDRVIEVDLNKEIIATFSAGGTISGAAFASRLPNGHTLITDANNNRIVEVDGADNVVWEYMTNQDSGSNANPAPTRAVRLKTGQTLISDQFNERVILINTVNQKIVAQYGKLNMAGFNKKNANGLNAPYDAKVIGDYKGLTAPN